MRKSRFSEAQIVQILAEYVAGAAPERLARRHSVHRASFFAARFGLCPRFIRRIPNV